MKRPKTLGGFVSDEAWAKLKLDDLDDDDAQDMIETMEAAFKGADPKKVKASEVADVVSLVQGIADNLREDFDETGFTPEVLKEAEGLSKAVLRDLRREKKGRRIIFKEVRSLGRLSGQPPFFHHHVFDGPVAQIDGAIWVLNPAKQVVVKILRASPPPPFWIETRKLTNKQADDFARETLYFVTKEARRDASRLLRKRPARGEGKSSKPTDGCIATEDPARWKQIVAEVKEAVKEFFKDPRQGRLTRRVNSLISF